MSSTRGYTFVGWIVIIVAGGLVGCQSCEDPVGGQEVGDGITDGASEDIADGEEEPRDGISDGGDTSDPEDGGDSGGSDTEGPTDADGSSDDGGGPTDGSMTDGDSTTPISCSGRRIACNGQCVDPYTDDSNCGACGTACAGTASCTNGSCSCGNYETYCPNNGGCVTTNIDNDNCGSCGNSCASGQVCNGGQCVSQTDVGCPAQTTYCSSVNQCIDLDTNDDHCGSCGTSCPTGQGCASGTCAPAISLNTPAKCSGKDPSISFGFKKNNQKQKCTGKVATTTFRWGLCSCDDVNLKNNWVFDAFNSQKGPYKKGGFGGGVGTNGKFDADKGEIYGSLWTSSSRGIFIDTDLQLYQQMHSGGRTEFSNGARIRGKSFIEGPLVNQRGGTGVTFDSRTEVDPNTSIQGKFTWNDPNSPVRQSVNVSTVCRRCKKSRRIPVETIVKNHSNPANNDNAAAGLNQNDLDNPNGPRALRLPCGKYYLSKVDTQHKLTIIAEGRTALFIDGPLLSQTEITIRAARGAQLDVFVNGRVNLENTARVGAAAFPADNRFYTNGSWSSVNNTALGGYVYAIPGGVNLKNNPEVFGGLYTQDLTTMNNPKVHYDRAVLTQRQECPEPCTEEGDACTSDGECCNALACTNNTCGGSSGGGGDTGVDGGTDGGTSDTTDGSSGTDTSCVSEGGSCSGDSDCCSSLSCSNNTCGSTCTQEGGSCSADGDCCSSLLCSDGTCGSTCSESGESCGSDGDCCSPLVCDGGTCGTDSCKNLYETCQSGTECCSGICGCSGSTCKCVSQ